VSQSSLLWTAVLTLVALVAFAANSLLCRMALGAHSIDPTSFMSIRLLAGAIVLAPLAKLSAPELSLMRAGTWASALALFVYALAFSLAYVSLNTATGALILFGTVQFTMIVAGLLAGERPGLAQWAGIAIAALGLVYLLLPGAATPSLGSGLLMMIAGCAWGLYSLWGRGVQHPLAITAANFVRAAALAVVVSACFFASTTLSTRGLILAATSGGLTSGVGYAIWYRALRGHTALSAAVVQLAVPMIAATGGVVVLGERPTLRLALATALTLGGIGTSLLAKRRPKTA
jgi:drug/metabolite transporter (DMT)-like permease